MNIPPILTDIPGELTTPRLRLRSPRPGDGPIVLRGVRDSLPELKAWMPWASDQYALNDAEDWCRRSAAKTLIREELAFLLFLADRTYIGNISAFAFEWKIPSCEIGYWLATPQRGQGLMTEAVTALTQLVQQRLSIVRIEIRTDVDNLPSRRVAEKSGYTLEAILKKHRRNIRQQLSDTCIYARITPDLPIAP